LIDWSNGMSGESLRAMIDFAFSGVTSVRIGGSGSSARAQPSSTPSRCHDSNRPSRFEGAPRPFVGPPESPRVVLSDMLVF
jgi:hypothetical protein